MVDVLGHLALALLFALPAWIVWDGRVSLAFVGTVLATAMLPDVDLVLRHVVPTVEHHGVTHTVLFVTVVSVVAGALAETVDTSVLERWWRESEGHAVSDGAVFLFVTGGFLLGGLSHLFGDVLSAPDVSEPIEPLWPVFDKPISIDVLYYTSPWWNLGLLVAAVSLHLALGYRDGYLVELVDRASPREDG
ncbi:metal-dependent hydrolase [Halomarina pelagica]|uniref:metal-dependent hydrolase n=1 Tax=Halomarina pelagica TaxID=2961599 RepID=UPI0020C2F146|nr:metal-dependent hydrolase [Halomarina sp. BND7]